MKNLRVLISESLFLGLASLGEAKQGFSRNISLSLTIIDSEVVSRELLGQADLMRAQTFCIHESTEVIIVSKDKDLVFAAFQVVALSLKGFNDSQELMIVGFVPSLSGDHLSREKGYWVPLANFRFRRIWIFVSHVTGRMLIRGHLTKDPTNSILQSISLNPNMTLWIQISKNRSLGKSLL